MTHEYTPETAPAKGDAENHARRHNEAMLRSEIGFWRELIATCGETQSPESLERMEQALALAESRLLDLFRACRGAGGPKRAQDQNVYYLHTGPVNGRSGQGKRPGEALPKL